MSTQAAAWWDPVRPTWSRLSTRPPRRSPGRSPPWSGGRRGGRRRGAPAFDAGPWPQADPADRAAALDRLAAAIEARAEDTARLVTAEMGMPIQLSRRNNVSVPCGIIRYYAALAQTMATEEIREAVSFAGRTVARRESAGVAAVIASWSYPLILAFCQVAPALAAGCTVVLKPAAETSPRSAARPSSRSLSSWAVSPPRSCSTTST